MSIETNASLPNGRLPFLLILLPYFLIGVVYRITNPILENPDKIQSGR